MSTTRFFTTTKAWQIFRPSHCALKLAINSSIYGIDAKAIANTLTDSLYSVWLLQHGYPAVQCEGKKDTANKPLMTSGSNNLT
ncbi:MAG: hypothetical protein RLZZ419_1052, partial [Pseudomonadota bacterium]